MEKLGLQWQAICRGFSRYKKWDKCNIIANLGWTRLQNFQHLIANAAQGFASCKSQTLKGSWKQTMFFLRSKMC